MKRKVIGLTIAGVVALSGVVSAASLWGSYKGNDIVRLTVDGSPTKVTDVPAVNYNGRTMIPIYLLSQAGLNYSWDAKNKTVDVSKVDVQGIQEVPISWMKLYSTAADQYMKLTLLAYRLDNLYDSIFIAMDMSLSASDPTSSIDTATTLYNDLDNAYNSLKKTSMDTDQWLKNNGLTSDYTQILDGYEKALNHFDSAITSVNKHKISKSNDDFASYQAELSAALNSINQVRQISVNGYTTYMGYIQNYQ